MPRSGSIVGGAAVALTLAVAPAADAASIESFRATASRDAVRYQIVLCAPVGAKVVFRTQLQGPTGRTYRLTPRTGRQEHECPAWRYEIDNRYPAGRYTTQVAVDVDGERLTTRRARVTLPG
jgi:hypothetical protein